MGNWVGVGGTSSGMAEVWGVVEVSGLLAEAKVDHSWHGDEGEVYCLSTPAPTQGQRMVLDAFRMRGLLRSLPDGPMPQVTLIPGCGVPMFSPTSMAQMSRVNWHSCSWVAGLFAWCGPFFFWAAVESRKRCCRMRLTGRSDRRSRAGQGAAGAGQWGGNRVRSGHWEFDSVWRLLPSRLRRSMV